jgi:hypothetical protein
MPTCCCFVSDVDQAHETSPARQFMSSRLELASIRKITLSSVHTCSFVDELAVRMANKMRFIREIVQKQLDLL